MSFCKTVPLLESYDNTEVCVSHVKIKDRKIENVKVTIAIDRLIIPLIP